MPSLSQVAAASALLALGAAMPADKRSALARGFTVKQVPNPDFKKPSLAQLASKSIQKWSSLAANGTQTGTVTATPLANDIEWLCPVTIGTQTFSLDFDTGSSDTWVLGSTLSSKGGKHTYYKPGSTSKLLSGQKWSIVYGDQSSASGNVYTDSVQIGGVTVSGQAVEIATKASSSFIADANDGLVGLAFDSINTVTPNAQNTFVTNAIAQGMSAVFTSDLRPGEAGSYGFGFIDSAYSASDIYYTDVDDSQGFWAFKPQSVTFKGKDYSLTGDTGSREPIADTGTTLLIIDDAIAQAYWQGVSGAAQQADGSYAFDCSAASSLPDFIVNIGDYKAVVSGPKHINLGTVQGSPQCQGGIMGNSGVRNVNIFGDVFLKSQFVVWDRTQSTPRIGFAPKAGSSANPPSSPPAPSPTATTTQHPKPTATTTRHSKPTATTTTSAPATTTTAGSVDCFEDPFDPSCWA